MDTDLLRYIPGLSKIFCQGQIDNIMTKQKRMRLSLAQANKF